MIEVVAGLIEMNNKYIIAKRTYGDKEAIGKWEFPGGKIENNEDDKSALKREIREELNLNIEVFEYLTDYIQIYDTRTIHLKIYYARCLDNNIKINEEHTDYALVKFKEIELYDLAPADIMLYKQIKLLNKF